MKARQLVSPVGSLVRPTTDKLRSAVFSILGSRVAGSDILDAFAGSGALGIEAYSRGAAHIYFIDKDTSHVMLNTQLMKNQSYTVRKGSFIAQAKNIGRQFDIIFIDPPYGEIDSAKILEAVLENNLLRDDGIIIYEEFFKTEFSQVEGLLLIDERKYGDTIVRFLERDL